MNPAERELLLLFRPMEPDLDNAGEGRKVIKSDTPFVGAYRFFYYVKSLILQR